MSYRLSGITTAAVMTSAMLAVTSSSASVISTEPDRSEQAAVPVATTNYQQCPIPLSSIQTRDFVAYRDGTSIAGDQIKDKVFAKFVADLGDRVEAEIAKTDNCGKPLRLTAIRLPLVASGTEALSFFDEMKGSSANTPGVRSPWALVRADASGIDVIVFYSERQFVIDEMARATGDANVESTGRPIPSVQFEEYGKLWEPMFKFRESDNAAAQRDRDEIAHKIPADIRWLFENSAQTTRGGPFSKSAKRKAVSLQEETYGAYLGLTIAAIREGLERPGQQRVVSGLQDLP